MRDAVTLVKPLIQFETEGEKFSLVQAFPKTGRTHQIRVHLKYLQRPIVGDRLYGESHPMALGFARVALHARTISFTAPDGAQVSVTAPYPEDFSRALANYTGA